VYQTLVKCGDHVIPTYLSTRRSAFQASAASFFTCHMWADVCKGALAVILALFNFAKIEFTIKPCSLKTLEYFHGCIKP